MRFFKHVVNAVGLTSIAVAAMTLAVRAADPPDFKPDGTFTGSALTGWRTLGDAEWRRRTARSSAREARDGRRLAGHGEDLPGRRLFGNYRCTGECQIGRAAARAAHAGWRHARRLYLFDRGRARLLLRHTRCSGRARLRRSVARRADVAAAVAPDAEQRRPRPSPGRRRPARGGSAGSCAANRCAGRRTGTGPRRRWWWWWWWRRALRLSSRRLERGRIILALASVRSTFGGNAAVDEANVAGYGSVALFVGGTGEVRYRDVAWKDLNGSSNPRRRSPRGSRCSRSAASTMDGGARPATSIVMARSTSSRGRSTTSDRRSANASCIGRGASTIRPRNSPRTWSISSPTSLAMAGPTSSRSVSRPMDLYVNPKGESRRWDKFRVLPTISSEIALMNDLDNDGKAEIVFAGGGAYNWARPDPANPTAVWTPRIVSSPGQTVAATASGSAMSTAMDGRTWSCRRDGTSNPRRASSMDVPRAHVRQPGGVRHGRRRDRGVRRQRRQTRRCGDRARRITGASLVRAEKAADGSRTFEQHVIAQDFSTENAGGVVFSESHAARFEDMDGDKVPDFITGKRMWSQLENYTGQDPYGAPVLYIYRTVRDAKAPGGAGSFPSWCTTAPALDHRSTSI